MRTWDATILAQDLEKITFCYIFRKKKLQKNICEFQKNFRLDSRNHKNKHSVPDLGKNALLEPHETFLSMIIQQKLI